MSAIIRNIIKSALIKPALDIVVANAESHGDICDFEFKVFTLNKIDSPTAIYLDPEHMRRNVCLDFDAVVNLRPFEDNMGEVLDFKNSWQLPLYNYILDIKESLKPENRLRKAEYIQEFDNFFSDEDISRQIYLPNSRVMTPAEFSQFLRDQAE